MTVRDIRLYGDPVLRAVCAPIERIDDGIRALVADLLDTGRHGHPTPDLQAHATAKIAEIDEKITDLNTIRAGLEQIVAAQCDSLTGCTCADCPIPYADLADHQGPTR